MNLRYSHKAKIDIDIAMGWYESQRKGLGLEFLNCLEHTINQILERPKLYSVKYKRYRSALIRRFPFSVFYTIEKREIVGSRISQDTHSGVLFRLSKNRTWKFGHYCASGVLPITAFLPAIRAGEVVRHAEKISFRLPAAKPEK